MRSVFLITFATSASSSVRRIYTGLVPPEMKVQEFKSFLDREGIRNTEDLQKFFEPENQFAFLRGPHHLEKFSMNVPVQNKIILNARDPRDWLCNKFYWSYQHPLNDAHPEKHREAEILKKRKERWLKQGIDRFVLKGGSLHQRIKLWFKVFSDLIQNRTERDYLVNSYALLCIDFDLFIQRMCEFMEVKPDETRLQELQSERSENRTPSDELLLLSESFEGRDMMPGRFRKELRLETAEALTGIFKEELKWLATYDHPLVQHTYL